jgi:signal transduction histidine kinase
MEQAERMAEKWEARSEAFWQEWQPNEGGYATSGYCKTVEDAEKCEKQAEEIREALANVTGSVYTPIASWAIIEILKDAAASRNVLDVNIK